MPFTTTGMKNTGRKVSTMEHNTAMKKTALERHSARDEQIAKALGNETEGYPAYDTTPMRFKSIQINITHYFKDRYNQ